MPDLRTLLVAAGRTLDNRIEAELLMAHVLQRDRAWLYAHADEVPDTASVQDFQALVARRAAGEPIAYLTGHRGFWTLDLMVSHATLVPRPETELLVEQTLARVPREQACAVADLGTGSGAIALAIASERPRARVLATDDSEAALEVARENADALGITNVDFARGDWLAPLAGRRFDAIVSNPPYVVAGDAHLRQGDLRFEPLRALVSGVDGLDAIRGIVRGAGAHLVPGGWLLFEHGWNQGEAARDLLQETGYRHVATIRDLESRDRVTLGKA